MSSPNTIAGTASPQRIAANRRNALKSTGPRTAAGKRRVALNVRRRDLCSEQVERQVRARGRTLASLAGCKRDLITIFRPKDGSAAEAVEQMARTWWDKAPPDAELGDGQPAGDRRARRAAGTVAPLPGLWRAPAAWVVAASTGGSAGPTARVSYRCATED